MTIQLLHFPVFLSDFLYSLGLCVDPAVFFLHLKSIFNFLYLSFFHFCFFLCLIMYLFFPCPSLGEAAECRRNYSGEEKNKKHGAYSIHLHIESVFISTHLIHT